MQAGPEGLAVSKMLQGCFKDVPGTKIPCLVVFLNGELPWTVLSVEHVMICHDFTETLQELSAGGTLCTLSGHGATSSSFVLSGFDILVRHVEIYCNFPVGGFISFKVSTLFEGMIPIN